MCKVYRKKATAGKKGKTEMSALIKEIVFSNEAGTEPVSVSEMRDYMNYSSSAQDTLIGTLITSARQKLERYCNFSFINRTITALFDNSHWIIRLPYGKVNTITTVKVKYQGEETTLAENTDYYMHGSGDIELVSIASGDIEVVYTVTGATDAVMKLAIKQQVAYWFVNRGDALSDVKAMELSAQALGTINPISKNVNFLF